MIYTDGDGPVYNDFNTFEGFMAMLRARETCGRSGAMFLKVMDLEAAKQKSTEADKDNSKFDLVDRLKEVREGHEGMLQASGE